jgi:hypothetical protein
VAAAFCASQWLADALYRRGTGDPIVFGLKAPSPDAASRDLGCVTLCWREAGSNFWFRAATSYLACLAVRSPVRTGAKRGSSLCGEPLRRTASPFGLGGLRLAVLRELLVVVFEEALTGERGA